ncbi:MAG TPA: hypothetical protein VJA40_02260 [archaeon]|nr:hypothetical protein [archaeon]
MAQNKNVVDFGLFTVDFKDPIQILALLFLAFVILRLLGVLQ